VAGATKAIVSLSVAATWLESKMVPMSPVFGRQVERSRHVKTVPPEQELVRLDGPHTSNAPMRRAIAVMQASQLRRIVRRHVVLALVSMARARQIPRHRLQDLHLLQHHHHLHQHQHLRQRKAAAVENVRVPLIVGREVPSFSVALIIKFAWTELLVELGAIIAKPAQLVGQLQHHHPHRHQELEKVVVETHAKAQTNVRQVCSAAPITTCAWIKQLEELGVPIVTIARESHQHLHLHQLHHQFRWDLVVRLVALKAIPTHFVAYGARRRMIDLIGPASLEELPVVAQAPITPRKDRIIFSSKRHALVDQVTQRLWKPR
jgi:hypothetical protein